MARAVSYLVASVADPFLDENQKLKETSDALRAGNPPIASAQKLDADPAVVSFVLLGEDSG